LGEIAKAWLHRELTSKNFKSQVSGFTKSNLPTLKLKPSWNPKKWLDEKWQKVREFSIRLCAARNEERQRFCCRGCGADKTLLAEVESL
jgi:hypothetical protein